jgi:hypothetical protein
MAGIGPAPKAQRQRERDTKRRQDEFTVITPDRRKRGPLLKEEDGFSPNVIALYEDMRTWPQAQLWEQSEWLIVRTLVLPLYEGFLNGRRSAGAAAELRQLLASLGATLPDRQRNRISIDRNEPVKEAAGNGIDAEVIDLMALMRQEPAPF